MLPAEFGSLEPFGDWILATEPERYAKRLASSMAEMQAFYDAAFPLLEPAMAYLDQFPLARAARGRAEPAAPDAVAGHGVLPGRGVETAACPR